MVTCIKCKQDVEVVSKFTGCVCGKVDSFFKAAKPTEEYKPLTGKVEGAVDMLPWLIKQIQGLK